MLVQATRGKWTKCKKGVGYDSYAGEPWSKLVAQRNVLRRLPLRVVYTINTCGERVCQQMAAAWCHRLQHMWDNAELSGPAELFWELVLSGYKEPAEVGGMYASAPGCLKRRIEQVRAIYPSRPAAS